METTPTPIETDTRIEAIQTEIARADRNLKSAQVQLASDYCWNREKVQATADAASRKIARLFADLAPLEASYTGWTRHFLVPGGHVHTTTQCSTCFPTTLFGWLTQFSGLTEAEIVGEVGERACTVCMPTAPTHPQFHDGTSRMTVAEREAKQAEKDAKQAKRDAQAAKKAADTLDTPVVLRYGDKIRSLREAGIRLTDALVDVRVYAEIAESREAAGEIEEAAHYTRIRTDAAGDVDLLVAAITARTGRDEDAIRGEWTKKAARRR